MFIQKLIANVSLDIFILRFKDERFQILLATRHLGTETNEVGAETKPAQASPAKAAEAKPSQGRGDRSGHGKKTTQKKLKPEMKTSR